MLDLECNSMDMESGKPVRSVACVVTEWQTAFQSAVMCFELLVMRVLLERLTMKRDISGFS